MLKPEHIKILKLAGLPHESILVSFDMTTIQRGAHYFQTGHAHVESYDDSASADAIIIRAWVKGTQRYLTTVRISRQNYHIHSECSCPVGVQCKHAVASVLEYAQKIAHDQTIHHARQNTSLEVQRWLSSLEQQIQPANAQQDDSKNENHLVYVLSTSDALPHRPLCIEACKAKPLKRGGYGQNYHINYQEALSSWRTNPYRLQAQDQDIVRLLATNSQRLATTPLELGGALNKLLFEWVLTSGRAFWRSTSQAALQMAAPRNMELKWSKRDNKQHLTRQVEPAISDYFQLNQQLYYVDTELGQCGLLQCYEFNAEQVTTLLKAPAIPELEAERVSQRLLEILPTVDLPLPSPKVRPQVIEIEEKPQIQLRIHTLHTDSDALHIASLSFVYAGLQVRPTQAQKASLMTANGRRYRIQHAVEVEKQAVTQLIDYGFDMPDSFLDELHLLDMVMAADSNSEVAQLWDTFLSLGVPELQAQGWHISQDDSFALQFDAVHDWLAELQTDDNNNAWFDLSLGFEIDGERINLLPILVETLRSMDSPLQAKQHLLDQGYVLIPLGQHRWVKLDASRLINVLDTLVELFDHEPLNGAGNLSLSRYQLAALHSLLNDPQLQWKGALELQALSAKLNDFNGIESTLLPADLNAELRPYQHRGVDWLQFLRHYEFNGILADDMGLGKTLQALAHLLSEKQRNPTALPSLIIAPTSLMTNWRREAEKFTPSLKVLVLHGSERKEHFQQLNDYDVIFTTYPLIVRDEELYAEQRFHYLILDEAQAIKNAKAKTTQAIFLLKATHRLCLTGTPMENHLGELWSMFHFLMPGFLGSHDYFVRMFRTPIEKQQDTERQAQLRKRVRPFMLRRTKELVASELPPKTEIIRTVTLEGKQRDLYETVRMAMDKKLRDEINQKGFARSQIMILDALLKLRQVCCDPRLVKLERATKVKQSAKLELLMEMLPEMIEEGRKILLFSQFTSMLSLIEQELDKHNIRYSKLTGQTRDRESAIDLFQLGDAKVFLISLKAGGTGLNLTAADTVIHYDPWWNPAAEQQATDRAYRIGQDKPVFVYKLISEETVEEKILRLQQRKQALADGLYSDKTKIENTLSHDDLMELLQPLRAMD